MPVRGVGSPLIVSLLLALAAWGCETRPATSKTDPAAKPPYTSVVVGDITPLYPEWKRLVRLYKEGLAQKLRESGAFGQVLYPAPVTLPPDVLVVEGVIDGVDEGSEFVRVLIANNASRASVRGRFRLVDGSGKMLAEFRQERVFGAAIIRDEQIYVEDLVGQFGRDTAGRVIRWSRGEDLEPDRPAAEWWDEILGVVD